MVKIVLFCAEGITLSQLAVKMRDAATEKRIDVSIEACSEVNLAKKISEIDVALLAPHIRYKLNEVKEICSKNNVPVDVLESVYFGTMDGEKSLEQALSLVKK